MRILRIKLLNFEGVEESEVILPITGVTIIEGPNEVGKSSLVRGMDLILQFPQESKHNRVLASCPVHTDAGPEVELELTTGPYHVTYWKRWHRRPDTTLTIHSPRRESLAGRTAHDRMTAILEETLDKQLFDALRFIQGSKVGQGAVGGSVTLISALDRAAAGGLANPDAESSLWQSVEAERSRYVTPGGRVSQERENLARQLSDAETDVRDADTKLRELEEFGESYRRVLEEIVDNANMFSTASVELAAALKEQTAIAALEMNLQALAAKAETSISREVTARRLATSRRELIDSIDVGNEDCRQLAGDLEIAENELSTAQAALSGARTELDAAEAQLSQADEELSASLEDVEYHRAIVSDQLLSIRLDRLAEAQTLETTARRYLDTCLVTQAARKVVDQAWARVRETQIALEVGSPTVRIEAAHDLDFTVNDAPVHLEEGGLHEFAVVATTEIDLPGLVKVSIVSASQGDDLQVELDEAKQKLAKLVQRYGLDPGNPPGDLTNKLAERTNAEADIKRAKQLRSDALLDLEESDLAAKAANAKAYVTEHPASRRGRHPLPATMEDANLAAEVAKQLSIATQSEVGLLRGRVSNAQSAIGNLRSEEARIREKLRGQTELSEKATEQLGADRKTTSDAQLDDNLRDAQAAADAARMSQESALSLLHERDPDTSRLRLENAESLTDRLTRERDGLEGDKIRLKTLLEAKGAEDLQATLDEASTREADLRSSHEDLERRAGAALLLYETFLKHRSEARLAYVAPYREEIEKLARLVFGSDTTIEVDPADFSLVSRTTNARTIPFDSLSTGAKEQLAVLARLACAILVNHEGDTGDAGVPVILDDALGNTDPLRLKALAPAFSAAAKRAQVIALASTPERYGRVGDATVIRITSE